MLIELRNLVATTRKQVSYLEPLVRFAADPRRATIATLNYDLSIERAGEAAGVDVHTGIGHWVNSGAWDWPKVGARLLKLHGSIDWAWEDDPAQDGRLPSRYIRQIPPTAGDARAPALVFGQRGKPRAEGPLLSLLAEFESQLEMASRLIAIGYSFRDDHVNQAIRRWAFEDRGSQIVLVDPGLPEEKPRKIPNQPFRESLLAHLEDGAPDAGSKTRLQLIQKPASIGIRESERDGLLAARAQPSGSYSPHA